MLSGRGWYLISFTSSNTYSNIRWQTLETHYYLDKWYKMEINYSRMNLFLQKRNLNQIFYWNKVVQLIHRNKINHSKLFVYPVPIYPFMCHLCRSRFLNISFGCRKKTTPNLCGCSTAAGVPHNDYYPAYAST